MNSFCALLVTGQEKAGGGFPRPWLEGKNGLAETARGKQVCLLGCPEKPGQASRKLVKKGVGLLFVNHQLKQLRIQTPVPELGNFSYCAGESFLLSVLRVHHGRFTYEITVAANF